VAIPFFELHASGRDKSHKDAEGLKGRVAVWGARGTRSSVIVDLDGDGDLDIVTNEFIERAQHGNAANLRRQVATAGAERVRHAEPALVNEGSDVLQARARGADYADRAATHRVREAERHAAHDRRAAIGPHHDASAAFRLALEHHLVLERHVVAEEHDMQAEAQRLKRFSRRVLARGGDEREVGVGPRRKRHLQAAQRGFL
jgi:hypothetical protein